MMMASIIQHAPQSSSQHAVTTTSTMGESLPPGTRTRHLHVDYLCNGSRHEAPTDRASSRLLHGARRRPTQGACSSLRVALRWRVLAPRQQASAGGFVFATEAAIKLRLVIEQDCGCSTVRGEGRLKVRALRCLWRVLATRDQVPAPAGGFPLQRKPPCSSD